MHNCKSIVDAKLIESLGSFLKHEDFTGLVDIEGVSAEELVGMLKSMLIIRAAESQIGEWVNSGTAKCPCHLAIGQEAVAVGVSENLCKDDRVFGAHRSHSHYLALKCDLNKLMAEILGKVDGCSKGMGGSMHLFEPQNGFFGSVPIVAATIPIAVGAGLALKKDGKGKVAVSYFGDGATEEGVFHESLNLASIMQLPVLFCCENNLYSSHLDINLRQPADLVSRFALAHKIESLVVDGNDVVAVYRAAKELLEKARKFQRPVFLEAVTYRHRGHVGPDENVDVGVRRKNQDIVAWKKRDPILRLQHTLLEASILNESDLSKIHSMTEEKLNNAVQYALNSEYPKSNQLLSTVYGGKIEAKI